MVKNISKYIVIFVFFIVVFLIFFKYEYDVSVSERKNSELVVFGENISTEYKPFVEDYTIYVSLDTISKTIDENIYYDKLSAKVIVTTDSNVVKLKIDEKKMSKNLEYLDIESCVKLVDDEPYVPIGVLKEIYNIKVGYNEKTNTVTIDKTNMSDIAILYNRVKVYSDISTDSNVIDMLNKDNKVTVYNESLNHKRWYKVKTSDGMVGYIAKNSIFNLLEESNENVQDSTSSDNESEKIVMFWQYGSDLDTLGKTKTDGVNVVSPTWYELSNSNGSISSKYSSEYYAKAKSLGYKIWPVITNGIDSSTYMPSDTSAMITSEYNREQFIKNLIEIAKKDKLDGINIDFEAMKTEDKAVYTEFIREMAPLLRKEGIKLSVDVYFVNYIDRKGIGAATDYIVLMGYDQRGNWSETAGSIAEVSWVEKNVESLINDSAVPSSKIILGVPFFTRLWITKAGETKPTTKVYTMQNCVDFIKKYKLTPTFDQNAGQNYVEYTEGSLNYKLWIEDKDSVKRRIETIKKYNLVGFSAWRKGFETSDIWSTVAENIK